MNELMKAAAQAALMLMPATSPRDTFIAAIAEERRVSPKRLAHVYCVLGTARDDEEWAETTRFVELIYESGVLRFASYYNHANVIGASQDYDCRLDSDQPWDTGTAARLENWSKDWRDLLTRRPPRMNASVY